MKESPLHSSLITRRRKENDVHQIQGSLLLEMQRKALKENHHTLNVTNVTRKVTMLEIAFRRTMVHATTLEATITSLMVEEEEMTEGMIVMEEMKEEEEMFVVIMKKITDHKGSQDIPGMKVMLPINLNIFLFLLSLVPLLPIRGIVG